MGEIKFQILTRDDEDKFPLIAEWYHEHWKVSQEKMIEKLRKVTASPSQFHVLMTIDNNPIATAGLHHHVSLQDRVPRFKIYKDWLALVYTIPGERGKGYGALLCEFVMDRAKEMGVKKMYLFTEKAESLYERVGWTFMEKLDTGEKVVKVMSLDLD